MKKDAENPLYEKIFKLKEYSGGMELGIALAIFSGSCLLMVIPLWYVQLTNLVKDTTTYARFARKPKTASNSSISPGIGPSMISNKSDTPSMIIQQEDIEWTHFFSGTSMTKSLSFRERIQIVQRKTCFGICAEQEVRMRDRDSKSHIVLDGGEMKEAKS